MVSVYETGTALIVSAQRCGIADARLFTQGDSAGI